MKAGKFGMPLQWAARITALATLAMGTVAYVDLNKTLYVDVDGVVHSVSIMGRTVDDVLSQADIAVTEGDEIYPHSAQQISEGDTVTVRTAKQVPIVLDGETQTLQTTAVTVGDLLDQLGTRATGALVSASRSDLVGREELRIDTLKNITVSIDGASMTTVTALSTVRDVLLDLDVVLDEGDTVSAELDEQLTDNQTITVKRAGTDSDTVTETLAFKTVERKDDSLVKGQKLVIQKGKAGKAVTTYGITTHDGAESERVVIARSVLTEPVDEIIGIGTLVVADPSAKVLSPSEARALAKSMVLARGWEESQFVCLDKLWTKESNWRVKAENRSSGAYGIPQSLPGSKMGSVGSDWRTNAKTQITWGLKYISGRYGTPCDAWGHSQRKNWY